MHAKGYGLRDVSKGLKVTPDTHFAIGSCSKAFTATALALLVEEGKLEWDKPVIDYLPDFRLYDDYATTHLRVRDLVTHQSGLPRHARSCTVHRFRERKSSRGFDTWNRAGHCTRDSSTTTSCS